MPYEEVSGNETFDASGAKVVGRTTSGGFGHCLGKSLALAYLSSAVMDAGSELEIKLMNDWYPARIRADAG